MQHHGGLGFREYVDAPEKECYKIQMFQRELSLSLELVTQGIGFFFFFFCWVLFFNG
jgi:hypothetical protein